MMQRKFTFPIAIVSLILAIGLGVQWTGEQRRTYRLTIATASRQGEYYALSQVLAKVIARHEPRIQLRVIETQGSAQNMQLLAHSEVELAIVQSDTPVEPSVRAIATLFPEVFHLIARADANIQSVPDLKGKRIALMPKGSGSYALFWQLSQHYDLSPTDFDFVTLSPTDAHAALRQGKVDALARVIGLKNQSVQKLLQATRAQIVPLDQVEALKLSYPFLEAAQIPKGAYNGNPAIPTQDVQAVAVRAILVTHQAVDSEAIRKITQILYEHRNELILQYPQAASLEIPDLEVLGLPLHPGAKAYYNQDSPNFFIEYAEAIGVLLSIAVLCASGLWQLRSRLLQRQKNRADLYNLEILHLIEQVYQIEDLHQLEKVRRHLFDIFQKVVVDLDEDRISPESFQSFTFPWEVAITTIRHREMILRGLMFKEDVNRR